MTIKLYSILMIICYTRSENVRYHNEFFLCINNFFDIESEPITKYVIDMMRIVDSIISIIDATIRIADTIITIFNATNKIVEQRLNSPK